MMVTRWFVTPLLHPDKLIDGPFDTRDECSKRCMLAMSEDTRARIVREVLEGRLLSTVGASFIPHPVHVELDSLRTVRYMPAAVSPPGYGINQPHDLLDKLRSLSRGKLFKIAASIKFVVPDSLSHNKMALATRLYNELVLAASGSG